MDNKHEWNFLNAHITWHIKDILSSKIIKTLIELHIFAFFSIRMDDFNLKAAKLSFLIYITTNLTSLIGTNSPPQC